MEYILGYSFDYVENSLGWLSAVRMAIQRVGHLPHRLVTDKFPGHNTEEISNFLKLIEKQGTTVIFTSAATGKARLERWFGTLQTVFMQCSEC